MNICEQINDVKVEVLRVVGKCHFKKGYEFPYHYVNCIWLYQTIYPYHRTFADKGMFSWIKEEEGVLCHCPKPEGLKFAVLPEDRPFLQLMIKDKGVCPLDYENEEYRCHGIPFCYRAFYILLPYIYDCSVNKKDYKVTCPDYPNYCVFKVSYNGNTTPKRVQRRKD